MPRTHFARDEQPTRNDSPPIAAAEAMLLGARRDARSEGVLGVLGKFRSPGRQMKTRAMIILAVLIGVTVVVAGVVEMYDQCGQICWQGLLQAQRERL